MMTRNLRTILKVTTLANSGGETWPNDDIGHIMAEPIGQRLTLEKPRRTAKHEMAEPILTKLLMADAYGRQGSNADTLIDEIGAVAEFYEPEDNIDPADNVVSADNVADHLHESTTLTRIARRRSIYVADNFLEDPLPLRRSSSSRTTWGRNKS